MLKCYLKRLNRLFGFSMIIRRLSVGDTAELRRTITPENVSAFARLTGDTNPIHMDQLAVTATSTRPIVHGALLNGIVSCLLGTVLPGHGTIVVNQYLEFPNSLFVGEEVNASVEITVMKRSIVECTFFCEATKRQKVVLKGYAKLVVRVPKVMNEI